MGIAPPLEDDQMQVDIEQGSNDASGIPPSPPRTPTNRTARSFTNFLSPIQRELNRPGTSLTQRTAGILNAEVRLQPIFLPFHGAVAQYRSSYQASLMRSANV